MYNEKATASLKYGIELLHFWRIAKPGQWFIGVIDTSNRELYLVPINVFDHGEGTLDQEVLTNRSARRLNRYASGAEGEREGISIMPDFMKLRPHSIPHHRFIVQHYGRAEEDCIGFSLIKTNNDFAMLKMSSASLNSDKKDSYIAYNFTRATVERSREFRGGAAQMPKVWQEAIVKFFNYSSFNIKHVIVSAD
ncbi:hypothetical protein ACGVWS_07510 [Enterobacteriaceae bacterium LUAb1]